MLSDAALRRSDLSSFFYDAFRGEPALLRCLIAARPYVCPFDRILPFIPDGADVLDVGCGNGALLALLAATGRMSSGLGCDVSAPALEAARAAAKRVGREDVVAFQQISSPKDIPADGRDVVVMVDVLHHVPAEERQHAVSEAARRVKPGGLFIYKDMTDKPFGRRLAHTVDDLIFSHELVQQVPPQLVEQWAEAEGFALVASEYVPRLIYGNVLRVFRRPLAGSA
jgi:2-polyprenyl-3-methyl-5-hydroxy-6-metoxy-1,4-benzoquinol methylase